MLPNLKFELSREEDKKILFNFSYRNNIGRGGHNLFQLLIKNFPRLKKISKLKKEKRWRKVNKFVNEYYDEHEKEIKEKGKKLEKAWRKEEKWFLKETEKMFNHEWPKANYIAYLTIFSVFPRNIKTKTFSVGYKNIKFSLSVICHELLHFLFYDYFYKNFKKKLNEENLWHFSEIVNVILFNKKPFNKFYNKISGKPYPSHIELYKKLDKIYNKCKDMKEFCKKSIKVIKPNFIK